MRMPAIITYVLFIIFAGIMAANAAKKPPVDPPQVVEPKPFTELKMPVVCYADEDFDKHRLDQKLEVAFVSFDMVNEGIVKVAYANADGDILFVHHLMEPHRVCAIDFLTNTRATFPFYLFKEKSRI